ncbi:MAG TPA: ferrous iron transport protein B [Fimbriimonadaceae bacterium]|nr:ferrous iron transport protein B [Fimbriimonadaceae bacterium]
MPSQARDSELRTGACHGGGALASGFGAKLVAIVGNPNAGKTTLFNSLTGSHQKVGNYPGVTVERVSGQLKFGGEVVEVIDVPGLYSLHPVSEDERVAADVIFGRASGVAHPDLLVCVVDASNLERNLYLYTQVAEVGCPMVVAMTMVDRVRKDGKEIDVARLSNLLGCEVVPVVGHKDSRLTALKEAIERNLRNGQPPEFPLGPPDVLETKVASLRERMARIGADFSSAEVREALANPTPQFERFLEDFPEMREPFEEARAHIGGAAERQSADVRMRYQWSAMVQRAAVRESDKPKPRSLTDKLDAILVHRVFGLIIFVALMYLVFLSIYTFAQPLMNGIQAAFDGIGKVIGPKLAGVPVLQSLIVDGIIGGVGAMLVFLPQILILFFFIAVLEGTGYLARAAFLMDRLLGWCGLNGRAFIPLLSSFACAIPGIMSARVMPDRNSRLATILVAPLMSCSARLPVYILLIGAFIQPKYGAFWAGFTLFAMHFLGLFVAIPIVWVLNRKVIRGKRLPFLLELPPYQWPKWRDVWIAMYFRGKVFVKTAGTIIVAMSFLIWALSYFPRSAAGEAQYRAAYVASHPQSQPAEIDGYVQQEQLAHSFLGRFGKTIEPVFRPAGFDWRITTSILAAFPARENVIPSLGIMFNLGSGADEHSSDLLKQLQDATWPDGEPLFTAWTAFGLMVFFALCAQCMATLATVKRETNSWKWAAFMFSYMTALAYIAAVGVHQLSRLF